MRVAVVDIGTNSTRLLIADVDAGSSAVESIARRSQVTRLGDGVDATGTLDPDDRAHLARAERLPRRDRRAGLRGEPRRADLGRARRLQRRGVRRARAGRATGSTRACSAATKRRSSPSSARWPGGRRAVEPTVVIDIGGGSTEFVVGTGRSAGFHVSLPAGVVRMSERHIHTDPPAPEELQALAADTRAVFAARPARGRARGRHARNRGRRHRHLCGLDRPGARPLRPRARARLPAAAGDRRTAARPARRHERSAAPRSRRACTPTARPRSSPA